MFPPFSPSDGCDSPFDEQGARPSDDLLRSHLLGFEFGDTGDADDDAEDDHSDPEVFNLHDNQDRDQDDGEFQESRPSCSTSYGLSNVIPKRPRLIRRRGSQVYLSSPPRGSATEDAIRSMLPDDVDTGSVESAEPHRFGRRFSVDLVGLAARRIRNEERVFVRSESGGTGTPEREGFRRMSVDVGSGFFVDCDILSPLRSDSDSFRDGDDTEARRMEDDVDDIPVPNMSAASTGLSVNELEFLHHRQGTRYLVDDSEEETRLEEQQQQQQQQQQHFYPPPSHHHEHQHSNRRRPRPRPRPRPAPRSAVAAFRCSHRRRAGSLECSSSSSSPFAEHTAHTPSHPQYRPPPILPASASTTTCCRHIPPANYYHHHQQHNHHRFAGDASAAAAAPRRCCPPYPFVRCQSTCGLVESPPAATATAAPHSTRSTPALQQQERRGRGLGDSSGRFGVGVGFEALPQRSESCREIKRGGGWGWGGGSGSGIGAAAAGDESSPNSAQRGRFRSACGRITSSYSSYSRPSSTNVNVGRRTNTKTKMTSLSLSSPRRSGNGNAGKGKGTGDAPAPAAAAAPVGRLHRSVSMITPDMYSLIEKEEDRRRKKQKQRNRRNKSNRSLARSGSGSRGLFGKRWGDDAETKRAGEVYEEQIALPEGEDEDAEAEGKEGPGKRRRDGTIRTSEDLAALVDDVMTQPFSGIQEHLLFGWILRSLVGILLTAASCGLSQQLLGFLACSSVSLFLLWMHLVVVEALFTLGVTCAGLVFFRVKFPFGSILILPYVSLATVYLWEWEAKKRSGGWFIKAKCILGGCLSVFAACLYCYAEFPDFPAAKTVPSSSSSSSDDHRLPLWLRIRDIMWVLCSFGAQVSGFIAVGENAWSQLETARSFVVEKEEGMLAFMQRFSHVTKTALNGIVPYLSHLRGRMLGSGGVDGQTRSGQSSGSSSSCTSRSLTPQLSLGPGRSGLHFGPFARRRSGSQRCLGPEIMKIAAARSRDPARIEELLRLIRQCCKVIHRLTNELVDLYKLQAHKVRLSCRWCAIRRLIKDSVTIQKELRLIGVRSENVRVVLFLDDSLVDLELLVDVERVSQILTNLISNALKYTDEGEVRIIASYDLLRRKFSFKVHDTGIGIHPSKLECVFQAFGKRVHPETKRESMGLGLAISREIVSLMRGSLKLDSAGIGKGTTATLELMVEGRVCRPVRRTSGGKVTLTPQMAPVVNSISPRASSLRSTTADHSPRTAMKMRMSATVRERMLKSGAGPNKPKRCAMGGARKKLGVLPSRRMLRRHSISHRIKADAHSSPLPSDDGTEAGKSPPPRRNPLRMMIVEDNLVNRRVLKFILCQRLGYGDAIVAENGQEALDILFPMYEEALQTGTKWPRLVIWMDVNMPVLDGIGAARAIRSRKIPCQIYAVTATVIKMNAQSFCSRHGFDGVIMKPVQFNEVCDILTDERKRIRASREATDVVKLRRHSSVLTFIERRWMQDLRSDQNANGNGTGGGAGNASKGDSDEKRKFERVAEWGMWLLPLLLGFVSVRLWPLSCALVLFFLVELLVLKLFPSAKLFRAFSSPALFTFISILYGIDLVKPAFLAELFRLIYPQHRLPSKNLNLVYISTMGFLFLLMNVLNIPPVVPLPPFLWTVCHIFLVVVSLAGLLLGGYFDFQTSLSRCEDSIGIVKKVWALLETETRFVGKMVHDLRAPVNGVEVFCSSLRDLARESGLQDLREYFIQMLRSVDDLEQSVYGLAGHFLFREERMHLGPEPVNVAALITAVLKRQNRLRCPKGVRVQLVLSPMPKYVLVDRSKLAHVLRNIISNAFKYTTHGVVLVNATYCRDMLRILVSDTGEGISEDKIELLDSFSFSDSSPWCGVGLAVTKAVVERCLGGSIRFVSVGPGLGTAVHIVCCLPPTDSPPRNRRSSTISMTDDDDSRPQSVVSTPNETCEMDVDVDVDDAMTFAERFPLRMLFVDDCPIQRRLLRHWMDSLGYDGYEIATNGVECIRFAQQKSFDVCFLDYFLPDMRGLEVASRVRAFLPEGRMLMMTGNLLFDAERVMRTHGIRQVLTKPIERESLMECLRELSIEAYGKIGRN